MVHVALAASPGRASRSAAPSCSMSSVVTPMIWVSPRSNSAEPCARGTTSTSADSGRMSVMPRPSMRNWSVRIRLADQLLVQRPERRADLLLAALELRGHLAPARSALISSVRAVALLLAGDRQRLREVVRRGWRTRRRRRRAGRPGTSGTRAVGLAATSASSCWAAHRRADERLRGLEARGDDGLGGRLRAAGDQLDRLGGGLGLHHHDRDVGVSPSRRPARRRPCRTRRRSSCSYGRERDPLCRR